MSAHTWRPDSDKLTDAQILAVARRTMARYAPLNRTLGYDVSSRIVASRIRRLMAGRAVQS